MNSIGNFFKKNWIRFIVSLAIGATMVCIYNFGHQISLKINPWVIPYFYRDSLFIAGMVVVFSGGLAIVSNFGVFDIFSFYPRRKKKEDGKKENYGDYVERRRAERSSDKNLYFLPYFIIGTLFLIASLILYFVLL